MKKGLLLLLLVCVASGYRFYGEMYSVGTFGEYWSSSPYINNYNHSDVCDLIFCPNYAVWSFNSQSANRSVRPVQ